MFANRYLERNKRNSLITKSPHPNLGLSIVIPCYREDEILKTLSSLKECKNPVSHAEVIIVINHSEIESEEIKKYNRQTKVEIENWITENQSDKISFFVIGPVEFQKKWAGAGLARKTGMDEAVRRFNILNKEDGIIVSLDADTLVEENYLQAIENYFGHNPKDVGATIQFRHRVSGLSARHRQGIEFYEQYMVYYKEAMKFTGYPFAMFTVGSAFAVKAGAYVRRGGMNRRQAGEDFYFLQNLAQIGRVGEIDETTVFPSARLSDRVPFGTGPILQKWMSGKEDLEQTYNFRAFEDLKALFDRKEDLFLKSGKDYQQFISELPLPVQEFLLHDNFLKDLNDLNQNCSSAETFLNRFSQKFNAFKILKYLNFTHEKFYRKASLQEQLDLLHQKR